jgi:hypothetical protein
LEYESFEMGTEIKDESLEMQSAPAEDAPSTSAQESENFCFENIKIESYCTEQPSDFDRELSPEAGHSRMQDFSSESEESDLSPTPETEDDLTEPEAESEEDSDEYVPSAEEERRAEREKRTEVRLRQLARLELKRKVKVVKVSNMRSICKEKVKGLASKSVANATDNESVSAKSVHSRQPVTCTVCCKEFTKLYTLNVHRVMTHNLPKLTRSRKNVSNISRQPGNSATLSCHVCNGNFATKDTLYSHHKKVHDLFLCDKGCAKYFPFNTRKEHFLTVHNYPKNPQLKRHACPICHKLFRDSYYVSFHCSKAHENLFYCYLCKLTMPLAERVQHTSTKHQGLRVISGKRLINGHACKICPLKFTDWNSMQRHYRTVHSQFYCDQGCSKLLPMTDRDMHIESFHTNMRNEAGMLMCLICDKSFGDASALTAHRKSVHKSYFCTLGCRMMIPLKDKPVHIESIHNKNK